MRRTLRRDSIWSRKNGDLNLAIGFAMLFEQIETPALLLDRDIMEANAARFLKIATDHGVALRPHLKTAKSAEVARISTGNDAEARITVSTLAEAEYFAENGFTNILYAVGMAPNKLARAARIIRAGKTRLLLLTDNVAMVEAAAGFALREDIDLEFLIEIDCGDGRGGVQANGEALLAVGKAIAATARLTLAGVMTHAGQSYDYATKQEIAEVAETERSQAVLAAERLNEAGCFCEIVSIGSTPTVAFANSLEGVTEARCGVYLFFDLDQLGRKVCTMDEIALSVLATVIGHNREAGIILVDAGGLALSKDVGANGFLPDAGYGYVCDAQSMERLGGLSVNAVNQEHGKITVDDDTWYDKLAVGTLVRIAPNHACMTAAAYPAYSVIEKGEISETWPRVNGW